jgi:trk system potassium uptake protein TrkA
MAQRIIILGAGRFGQHLATRLSEYGCEVVLAERSAARVKELAEDGYHIFEMDVEDEDALKELGVAEADVVVVSIGENLQGSVLATLALKELQVKKIVTRALDAKHAQVLEKVGADLVVLPSRDMAYRLAERLRDNARDERHPLLGGYQLAEVRLGPALANTTLLEAKLPQRFKITAVLVTRSTLKGTPEVLEPSGELTLAEGDRVFVVGKRENINRFEVEFGIKR